MKPLPGSVNELIDELDAAYPEQPSSPETSREDDLARGGIRQLIIKLKQRRDHARREPSPRGKSHVRR
ncbi:hypothetical protein QQS45_08400 [Alteriqipengyuania flavescens]|uniref:hypothetical protein n=1 Tax=Alteriqipengyuania flavescens TaxID=3053610 RepID=UPI0025B603B6|nr:hypothetical protein [Alteriqipengyuania flavescens]WJY17667.1 hypothetical protein QQW98_08395 [Alteriqipengyuania flavescens]WJY23610.1 hypothetical protein QQS45_08400 [Alteriqipengyuania flavescens]